MPSVKEQINFRITDQGKQILVALQNHYGVSQAAVFEMLLRDRKRDLEAQGYSLGRKLGDKR